MNTIAETIYEHMGGRPVFERLPVKELIAGPGCLKVMLKSNRAKHGINQVVIKLTPDQTYCIDFLKFNASKMAVISRHTVENLAADQIRIAFEEATGLHTTQTPRG